MFKAVTSLTIMAGAAPTAGADGNHIIVYDQLQRMLHPTNVHWVLGPALVGVEVTADETGFFFTCAEDTGAESDVATATYDVNGVTGTLKVSVEIEPVTSLLFSQE